MVDTLELCRWAYNETLAVRKNAYTQESKSISYYETKSFCLSGKMRSLN